MIPAIGKVYLNGERFTTDPKIARDWPPRRSRLLGLDGSVTQQDFGRHAKDVRLTLTSGGNYMNASLKAAIETMMISRGADYSYTDYTGLEGRVVIVSFVPEPTFIRDGARVLYEYTLVLDVVQLDKLDGTEYQGS